MSKGGSQTQTQTLDPQSQAYVNQMRQLALGYAGMGGASASAPPQARGGYGAMGVWNPNAGGSSTAPAGQPFAAPAMPQGIQDAQNQYNQYAQGGNLGFSALTGNASAAQQFMNPYTQNMNPFFAQQRALAVQGANDQATQMGAFGGDRSQIGAAVAGSQADQNQAGFQYDAFNQAMQMAGQAANLGYGASAQAAMLPQQYQSGQLGLLQQGMGPYGQTQTTKTSSDPFSQLLGLGLTLFGPGGLLAKGALAGATAGAGSGVMGSFSGGGGYG